MPNIGSSILKRKSGQSIVIRGVNSLPLYVNAVVKALETSEAPLTISEIQERTGIKTWVTTKRIVTKLVERGYVKVHHKEKRSTYYVLNKN
mgnify:CR=1 FL=1